MPVSKRSLPVACTLEDAFEYVADWTNLKNFMSMLLDLHPTSLVSYGPGTSLETKISLVGMEIVTTFDLVEFQKNKRILYKANRGIKSKLCFDFSQLEDKVLVAYSFEYEIPPGLSQRDSDRQAIEKDMQERADQSMDLLKWLLEAQRPAERT